MVKKAATCVRLFQQTLHSHLSTVDFSPISKVKDNESPILTTVVKAAMAPLAEAAYTDSTELASLTDVADRDVTTQASSIDTVQRVSTELSSPMGTMDIQMVMPPQAIRAITDSTEFLSPTNVAYIDVAALASSVDTVEKVSTESSSPIKKTDVKVEVAAPTTVEYKIERDFTKLSSPVATTDVTVAALSEQMTEFNSSTSTGAHSELLPADVNQPASNTEVVFTSITENLSNNVLHSNMAELMELAFAGPVQLCDTNVAVNEIVEVLSGDLQSQILLLDLGQQDYTNLCNEEIIEASTVALQPQVLLLDTAQLGDMDMQISYNSAVPTENSVTTETGPRREDRNDCGRSHKKTRRNTLWKRVVKKSRRNTGQAYENYKGQKQRARMPRNSNHCCRNKCFQKVTQECREAVFNQYWSLGSWELQTSFLLSSVQQTLVKRRKKTASNSRKCSYIFVFGEQQVCRKCFRESLDISDGRLHRALERKHELVPSARDRRGKHGSHKRLTDEQLLSVRNHIDKLPKYSSHYSRMKNPDRMYLNPGLTMSDLYKLYCKYCDDEHVQPVKKWAYTKIFNTEYNLAFKQPSTDTCSTCDRLQCAINSANSDDDKKQSALEKEVHLRKADSARDAYRIDVEDVKFSTSSVCIVFDLQKTLPTPKLQTSKVFYMRQLWTYNLNIHDCKSNSGNMFMWHEGTASRGSQEVASCLLKFCKALPPTVTKLTAYSDCCGGQNRNENIAVMWLYIVKFTNIQEVTHKFFEPGHSYNACDQDFGVIEKRTRRIPYVWTPADWYTLVSASCKNFKVTEMNKSDFLSLDEFKKTLTIRKKADDGRPVSWLTMKTMAITKDLENVVRFKTSLCEDAEMRQVRYIINQSF
jgi:hypothetical protein